MVAALGGAALRDVMEVTGRRAPGIHLLIAPAAAQGERAVPENLLALQEIQDPFWGCEVILLVRGGGSLEDLLAFNDEAVARAIAASPLPVVAGVGHETDFSIADFVADLRAPTPTAAAGLATPDRVELGQHLDHLARRLAQAQRRRLDFLGQRLDSFSRRLRHPAQQLAAQRRHLEHLHSRLRLAQALQRERGRQRIQRLSQRLAAGKPDFGGLRERVARLRAALPRAWAGRPERARLAALASHLGHLNPQAVLERGYSITRDSQGRVVRDGAGLGAGERLDLSFARGGAVVRVEHGKI